MSYLRAVEGLRSAAVTRSAFLHGVTNKLRDNLQYIERLIRNLEPDFFPYKGYHPESYKKYS